MTFLPFDLERWQSDYEQDVEYNLADSSVRAVTMGDLLGEDLRRMERLRNLPIHYPEVNGTTRIREQVAALYNGVGPDQVLITVGAAEANQIACQYLLEPGSDAIVMEPGYRQVWGLTHNLGATAIPFPLRPDQGWRPDLGHLAASITDRTRLISIVNPNNPTGTILTESEIAEIIRCAASVGAWILADEVYRGSERYTDVETPSIWGKYDRVIAVGSLSKAYGLSGARIGWIVAPRKTIPELWRRHEYATIATSAPSMLIGEFALEPGTRHQLIARQRMLLRHGWQVMDEWLSQNTDLASVGPSEATSLGFVRYALPRSSVEVSDAIRRHASVLVAPGEYLGANGHVRISHGYEPAFVRAALDQIGHVLRALRDGSLT